MCRVRELDVHVVDMCGKNEWGWSRRRSRGMLIALRCCRERVVGRRWNDLGEFRRFLNYNENIYI